MTTLKGLLETAARGLPPRDGEALALLINAPLERLQPVAESMAADGHGIAISYSRKVFVPVTQLCRNSCGYCTFAHRPHEVAQAYMLLEEVLKVAHAGATAGCREALFTLGDKPELRYPAAREALQQCGHATTTDYVVAACEAVLSATDLLPHVNSGVLTEGELKRLRPHAVSMGLMLESASHRLCEKGGPHFKCPDKAPAARLESLRAAGRLRIPCTSGILIGIGETRYERIEALLALRHLQDGNRRSRGDG